MGYFEVPEPIVMLERIPKGKRLRRWQTEISLAAGSGLAPVQLVLAPEGRAYELSALPLWIPDGVGFA